MKTLGILLLGLMLVSAPAHASRRGGGWLKNLELTQEQKEQLKTLRESSKESRKANRKQMKAARMELAEAVKGDASEAQLRTLFNNLQDLHKKMAESRFEKMLGIRAILTKEQRQKIDLRKFGPGGGRGKDHHGRRGHRRGQDNDERDSDEDEE